MKKPPFDPSFYSKIPNNIRVSGAAKLVGRHQNTIRRWEKAGRISSNRTGSRKDRLFDKKSLIKEVFDIDIIDAKEEAFNKYCNYFKKLFKKALKESPVDFVYTMLSVSGVHYGHWDPAEELMDFFDDFSELLKNIPSDEKYSKRKYRVGMVMYCHAVEMSLPWKVLANTLRAISGKNFVIDPYSSLRIKKKSLLRSYPPPSPKRKIEKILKPLAKEAKEPNISKYIDEFFNDRIRNAFYHSDYCITKSEFRYKDAGIWTSINLSEIDTLIVNCFAFYEAFFTTRKSAIQFLGKTKKYHKWPNYEVFEVLSNDKGIYGFKVHFSNGSHAKFSREPEKVEAINIIFNQDGSVNFMAGNLDKLKPVWLVDGRPFDENG